MLIAIMGESFSKNNEIGESKKRMSQLSFVVDNWWLDPIKDKNKIVYIIAGIEVEDEDDDQEKFDEINNKIDELAKQQ